MQLKAPLRHTCQYRQAGACAGCAYRAGQEDERERIAQECERQASLRTPAVWNRNEELAASDAYIHAAEIARGSALTDLEDL